MAQPAVKNGLSFDVEDWFQVENLRGAIDRQRWDDYPLRVEESTRRVLGILDQRNTKATFFFLGWVAKRRPQLVRDIQAAGHEIACHGFDHELVYRMSPEDFRNDIRTSKALLEDISGKPVRGYRAPSFSITERSLWAIDVLREEGFAYDSSVFPTSMHDRYGMKSMGTRPFKWPNGLLEIPLAVYQAGNLALPVAGGGYFRLFPYLYFRVLLSRLNARQENFAFYMHPWEFDPGQPRMKVRWSYALRHYVNLHRTSGRLGQLIRDFEFCPMAEAFGIAA